MSPPQSTNPLDLSGFEAEFAAELHRVNTDPDYAADLVAAKKGNPIDLGPPVLSPAEWADKQVTNATAAASLWLKNVKRPRREPIKAALAAAAKREQKLRESLEQKKWEKAMANVDEADMYATIDAVGAEGYRRGVAARKNKVARVAADLQPRVAALKKTIQAMPDADDSQREARLLAARRGMIQIGHDRRGI